MYRASKKVGNGVRECRRLKVAVDQHLHQTDKILDTAEFAQRVNRKEVRSEDVRSAASVAVSHIPDFLKVVVEHVRRQNAKA